MLIAIVSTVPETLYYLLEEQIPFFKKKGFEVIGITSEGSWIKAEDINKKYDIEVKVFEFTRVISIKKDLCTLFQMIRWFKKIRPDILHVSTPKASLLTLIAGWVTRVPNRIYTIRGLQYPEYRGLKKCFYMFLDKLCCTLARRVIAVSDSNMEYIIKNKISRKEKVSVLAHGSSHGVDSTRKYNPAFKNKNEIRALKNRMGIAENDVVIGFIGRMVKEKGVEDIAVIWKQLSEKNKNCHLVLVGPLNEPRDHVSAEYITYFNNNRTVHMVGDARNPFSYYSIMDIVLFPSYREGFPNVVIEAGAMELPVISTDAMGCRDAVEDTVNGIVVPVGDVKKLQDACELLINNKTMRVSMGIKARARVVERYQPEDICEESLKIYETLLESRRNR